MQADIWDVKVAKIRDVKSSSPGKKLNCIPLLSMNYQKEQPVLKNPFAIKNVEPIYQNYGFKPRGKLKNSPMTGVVTRGNDKLAKKEKLSKSKRKKTKNEIIKTPERDPA